MKRTSRKVNFFLQSYSCFVKQFIIFAVPVLAFASVDTTHPEINNQFVDQHCKDDDKQSSPSYKAKQGPARNQTNNSFNNNEYEKEQYELQNVFHKIMHIVFSM